MHTNLKRTPLILLMILGGCVSIPNGPKTMALPGIGKSFDQFRIDDSNCRQFALNQIGGKSANEAANDSFAKTAILGTALGAAIGAAAGGGHGAGVGAATGLIAGSAIGANASNVSAYETQQRYDNAYTQCMYSSGHKVSVPAGFARPQVRQETQAPSNYMPPPPPPPSYGYPVPPDLK